MTPTQLTSAAELAPDCPIIALALMLRMAEMPYGSATDQSLISEAMPLHRVKYALGKAAWNGFVSISHVGIIYFTNKGSRLIEAATEAQPIIEAHITNHKARIAALTEKVRIELAIRHHSEPDPMEGRGDPS